MYGCSACMDIMCVEPTETRRWRHSLELELEICQLPCGCWGLILGLWVYMWQIRYNRKHTVGVQSDTRKLVPYRVVVTSQFLCL